MIKLITTIPDVVKLYKKIIIIIIIIIMKNCVCIVCRLPNQLWLDFLNSVPGDIFMVINDKINYNNTSCR